MWEDVVVGFLPVYSRGSDDGFVGSGCVVGFEFALGLEVVFGAGR